MKCPYCGGEMQQGVLSGDGRRKVRWKAGDKKASWSDALADVGTLTAAKCTLTSFTMEAFFCKACKKMVIDTDVK